jgi:hypothetical protein
VWLQPRIPPKRMAPLPPAPDREPPALFVNSLGDAATLVTQPNETNTRGRLHGRFRIQDFLAHVESPRLGRPVSRQACRE